jgi:hypothetical protein
MRRQRQDSNKKLLVTAILGLGGSWTPILPTGEGGQPDGLAGFHGIDQQVEIKAQGALPSANPETWEKQAAYRAGWRGRPVVVLRTVEEVQELERRLRDEALDPDSAERRWGPRK